ncbi:MAG: hypothetical protein AAB536_01235 [Patescibacteria group bacterium]
MNTKRKFLVALLISTIAIPAPVDFLSSFKSRDLTLQVQVAEAAAKTKTIEFFIGSIISTTPIANGVTSTYAFVIALPDMVPTSQPIRSAYISYNTHPSTASISACTFTLNVQGGIAQSLTCPSTLTDSAENRWIAFRLDATSAMQTLIGNASGTYAMIFTTKITGPTRSAESAKLIITYDYDPFAPTQVNTDYRFVFATSSQMGKALVTSANFNFGLPESGATTTFSVGASSSNQFWAEFRARISTTTAITVGVGWDSEATSAATFAQLGDSYSVLMLNSPTTADASPSGNHTFKMQSISSNSLSNPNAVAVATYTFNFNASSKLRKNIQVWLMQNTNTASTATLLATTTINIPETSPSSTNAFLLGRTNFTATANPGMNATLGPGTPCTNLTTTAITETPPANDTTGYATPVWNVAANLATTTGGDKIVCSAFSTSGATSIRGMKLFWSYDHTNSPVANANLNNYLSFLAQSNMSVGTSFATTSINTTLADSSTTAKWAWLDGEYDDSSSGNGVAAQFLELGINNATTSYSFPNTLENTYGESFSATSSAGFSASVVNSVRCTSSCINDASYNIYGQTSILAANMTQIHYHWRNDDGSEATSTAAASEDTSLSIQGIGTVKRLRFEISNEGDATSSAQFRIEYQANSTSGTWTQLATSTAGTREWQMSTSSLVADGTATTNIATSTGGTTDENIIFNAAEVVATTSRNQANSELLSGIRFTEVEYSIMSTSNASSATYYFRVSDAGTGLTTYSVYAVASFTPTATVSCSASASSTDFGTIDTTGIFTSSPNASTSMSCDGALGCVLYVNDNGSSTTGGGLYASTTINYLIKSPDAAFNATATLAANTDGYGIQGATTTAGSGGTLTLNIRYLQSGNTVGGLATTTVILASSTAAVTNREVVVTHKATVGASATGGVYADTITFSCVSN